MKDGNFETTELIRIKLPLQAAFRALTFRPRLISNNCILGKAMEWGLLIWVSDQGPVANNTG